MLAFTLTAENAALFFEICHEIGADTEQKRILVLQEMAKLGHVQNIVETPKSKDEYLKHLAKNFKVLKIGESNDLHPQS